MKLRGVVCSGCGDRDLLAVSPGQAIEAQGTVLPFVKPRPDVAWCRSCWISRWVHPLPPQRGGKAKAAR